MKVGFETIGNATITVFDNKPLLVTDPWITPDAYFGSWGHTHEIPNPQLKSILACPYVWFSHGHPDHLNPESLPYFKGKTILLPDHLGGRIHHALVGDGFTVRVLKNRRWEALSENVKILCLADHYQDAILLIDINGRLVINCNDAIDFGRDQLIKRIARNYSHSFVCSIASIGIADMMNYYDETGKFIFPEDYKNRAPSGKEICKKAERFGARYFVPTSFFHSFKRTDSAWANEFSRPLSDLSAGFRSDFSELLPPFIRFDCELDKCEKINPKPKSLVISPPEAFGDNWNDCLERSEISEVETYFKKVEHLGKFLDFISLKVGGKTHPIVWNKEKFNRGITFEVPRASLMTSIKYSIFEDLLIGNFMKTTLHGNWPTPDLSPEFSVYVGKYSDNGFAHTEKEVRSYLRNYALRNMEFRSYYWMPRVRQTIGKALRLIPGYSSFKQRLNATHSAA